MTSKIESALRTAGCNRRFVIDKNHRQRRTADREARSESGGEIRCEVEGRRVLIELIESSLSENWDVDRFNRRSIAEKEPPSYERHRHARLAPAFEEEARHVERIDDIGRLQLVEASPDDATESDENVGRFTTEVKAGLLHAKDRGRFDLFA